MTGSILLNATLVKLWFRHHLSQTDNSRFEKKKLKQFKFFRTIESKMVLFEIFFRSFDKQLSVKNAAQF